MIIKVYDYQIQRENVTRHILSSNIKFVSVCDHLEIEVRKNKGSGFEPGTEG